MAFNLEEQQGESFTVIIRSIESGNLFQLQAEPKNGLDKKPTHSFINKMYKQILLYNYQSKFGTWEYNKFRGDIRFAVEIHLEDSLITFNQFNRIVNRVESNLKNISELKNIFIKGKPLDE